MAFYFSNNSVSTSCANFMCVAHKFFNIYVSVCVCMFGWCVCVFGFSLLHILFLFVFESLSFFLVLVPIGLRTFFPGQFSGRPSCNGYLHCQSWNGKSNEGDGMYTTIATLAHTKSEVSYTTFLCSLLHVMLLFVYKSCYCNDLKKRRKIQLAL